MGGNSNSCMWLCSGGGPYLLQPTGIWHVKIYSCSRIVIHLRYKETILLLSDSSLAGKCSGYVLTGCGVDNGHTSS